MAKRIIDEEMRFTVIINGNEAQKELYDLEKSTRNLTKENKDLRAERSKLAAQGKRHSEEYKKLTLRIKANSKTIEVNKTKMKALQKEIGLTGLTMAQLGKKAAVLRIQLRNMVPDSALYKKFEKDLQAVNTRMAQLRNGAKATQGSVSKLAGVFNKYQALTFGLIAGLTGVVFSLQKMIDFNGKLSDAMSDVQKTTGLAKNEVEDLAKSFGLLKTRTTRINLLEIAEQGGRIGIVKEEIGQFVEVMNRANVALGDSFTGGVEEVASKLGKLKFLFKETKDLGVDEAYSSIGSALNELGASGNSTEANITEFALRLGALPDALKPTITETLALGATFEESGVQAEIAARAYSIFITKAAKDTDKFAKVMGLSKKQVKEMINTDPLQFFLDFSKGLNGMDATDIAKTLDFLSVNATGVQKALGAAANNSKRFTEQQQLANDAAEEGTSLLKEYEIKNNNLAAILEKVGKRIRGAFASDFVVGNLAAMVEWFAKFIGASEDATGGVTRFKNALVFLLKLILTVSTALVTNIAWLKLVAIWEGKAATNVILHTAAKKANLIATELAFAATQLYAAATMLLSGNIKGATQAIRVLSATMKTTPWGLVLGLVSALVVAYVAFSKQAEKAATKQTMLADAFKAAQEKTTGLISKIQTLQEVVEDETASEEARLAAMKKLNKIVPDYNKNLDLSKQALEKGKTAIDLYIESLVKQAEAQFLADQVTIKSQELMKLQNTTAEKHLEWWDQIWLGIKNGGRLYGTSVDVMLKGEERKSLAIGKTKSELDAAKEAYKEYIKINPNSIVTEEEFVSPFVTPTGDDDDKKTKGASSKDSTLSILEKNVKLKNQLIEDDFYRELALMDRQHVLKLQKVEKQLIDETGLKGEALASARFRNQAIHDQILLEEEIFQTKQETLALKYIDKDISNLVDSYEREAKQRRANFALELAELELTEEERKIKQTEFDEKELISRGKHTQEVIDKINDIISGGEFKTIDITILTEAQKEALIKRLEDLGLSISEINKLLAIMQGKGDELGTEGENDFDIFGFTVDQWQDAFTNLDDLKGKLEAAGMAVKGLMNTWQFFNDITSANEKRRFKEFDKYNTRQRNKLKSRLDSGLVSQRQYDTALKALEKQKVELEYQAAVRAHKNNLTQAYGNTAMAVINGLQTAPFFPLGIAMGALAGILGGIQIASISKNKPVRGFEEGYGPGYTFPVEREQDGKIFNASYGGAPKSGMVNKPTILVGEMPELIITNPDLKKFNPAVTASLRNEIARVRGYETGRYPSGNTSTSQSAAPVQESGVSDSLLVPVLIDLTDILTRIKEEGTQAWLAEDMENFKKIKKGLTKFDKYREKSQP